MSIVSCPRCGDKVSVPPAASPAAMVQCPLCLEEYFLSDALIQLPPMLKVVGASAAAGDKEGDYRLAPSVSAAVGASLFAAGGEGTATVAPRPQLRTVSRPRRQEKSAVGEIVKVVLGGVAGLAGGLLVLWWGFGVDVGNLGPRVSKVEYLRFLVPPKLWDRSIPSGKASPALDTLTTEPKPAENPARKTKPGAGEQVARDEEATGQSGFHNDFGFGIDPGPAGAQPERTAAQRGKTTAKTGAGAAATKVNDDPFQSLEDLGVEARPAGDPLELKIDDPLTIAPPSATDSREEAKSEEPPADSEVDRKENAGEPQADKADEKPADERLSEQQDPGEDPAAEDTPKSEAEATE